MKGIPVDSTREAMASVFSRFGKVMRIIWRPGNEFAFLEFDTAEAVKKALDDARTVGLLSF